MYTTFFTVKTKWVSFLTDFILFRLSAYISMTKNIKYILASFGIERGQPKIQCNFQ